MSDFSLTLVLQFKTSKIINDMAKVQIKSEKVTPFGGIIHVRELISRYMAPIIDKVLGLRCASYGYQYSEIVGSLSSVYFCGGDCVEDVTCSQGVCPPVLKLQIKMSQKQAFTQKRPHFVTIRYRQGAPLAHFQDER